MESPFRISRFVHKVEQGDYDAFFRHLQGLSVDTPRGLVHDLELHYQNVLFIVFKLTGFYIKAEYHTLEGRINLILQADQFIYVIEFRLDDTVEGTIKQINDKHYVRAFNADRRKLYKIGINFSNKIRNIER